MVHRVYDDDLLGFLVTEHQIEEQIPDAGAHVHNQDVRGQRIIVLEVFNHRGAEPVITEQDIAAAEDQGGFVKQLSSHGPSFGRGRRRNTGPLASPLK